MCQYSDPEPGRDKHRFRRAYRYAECHRELVMDTLTETKEQKMKPPPTKCGRIYPRPATAQVGYDGAV